MAASSFKAYCFKCILFCSVCGYRNVIYIINFSGFVHTIHSGYMLHELIVVRKEDGFTVNMTVFAPVICERSIQDGRPEVHAGAPHQHLQQALRMSQIGGTEFTH